MTTHSQLVDSILQETLRPDMVAAASAYLNQTIREMHFDPARNNALVLMENYREVQVTATTESQFMWEYPNPGLFQALIAVRYDCVVDADNCAVYAKHLGPSRRMEREDHVVQQAGGRLAFKGYGGYGAPITIAYSEYPPSLVYQPVESRLVTINNFGQPAYVGTPTEQQQQQYLKEATNWILMRWADVVAEGVKAKLYKRLGDETRQRTSYSLYSQLRQGFISSEEANLGQR